MWQLFHKRACVKCLVLEEDLILKDQLYQKVINLQRETIDTLMAQVRDLIDKLSENRSVVEQPQAKEPDSRPIPMIGGGWSTMRNRLEELDRQQHLKDMEVEKKEWEDKNAGSIA